MFGCGLLWPIALFAAGSQGTYPAVTPGQAIALPADGGSHPDHRIEWWYVTGWLEARDASGAPLELGFQVTFFRHRPEPLPGAETPINPSRFAATQLLFAHAAVSDPRLGRLRHDQRVARAGFGLAEAAAGRTDLRLEDWTFAATGIDASTYEIRVAATDFTLALSLERTAPVLLQGDAGYSRKGPGPDAASHYYSEPHLRAAGVLRLGGERLDVRGTAWLDHEWSSSVMDEAAQGWDWIGINLDDGGALMAFQMRDRAGGAHWVAARERRGDGTEQSAGPGEVMWQVERRWRSPRTGVEYPVEWSLSIRGRRYRLVPLFDDQESDARASTGTLYWEGAVTLFELDADGRTPVGRGYLELTGYGSPLRL